MKPDLFVEKSIKEFLSTKQTNWLHQQRYPPRPSKIEKKKKKKKKKNQTKSPQHKQNHPPPQQKKKKKKKKKKNTLPVPRTDITNNRALSPTPPF
jgi:DNA mismatch repair ATPase MutL